MMRNASERHQQQVGGKHDSHQASQMVGKPSWWRTSTIQTTPTKNNITWPYHVGLPIGQSFKNNGHTKTCAFDKLRSSHYAKSEPAYYICVDICTYIYIYIIYLYLCSVPIQIACVNYSNSWGFARHQTSISLPKVMAAASESRSTWHCQTQTGSSETPMLPLDLSNLAASS